MPELSEHSVPTASVVAIAASIALPPSRSIRAPIAEANLFSEAIAPREGRPFIFDTALVDISRERVELVEAARIDSLLSLCRAEG